MVITTSNLGGYFTHENDSSARTWAGNFNGGTLLNTDNTISSNSDGGNYTGSSDARTWSANFNGGMIHGPLSWLMAENLFWIEPGTVTSRFTGVRISPVESNSIVTAVRIRGATAGTTVSNVFILVNGAYTLLISSATVGTDWVEFAITPKTVPAGATVELAMTSSAYTWVTGYYAGSPILEGFEAATQGDTWVATDNAFGIDLKFAKAL